MSIRAQCAQCQKVYQVPDAMAGKTARCKVCKAVVQIPAELQVRIELETGAAPEPVPQVQSISAPAQGVEDEATAPAAGAEVAAAEPGMSHILKDRLRQKAATADGDAFADPLWNPNYFRYALATPFVAAGTTALATLIHPSVGNVVFWVWMVPALVAVIGGYLWFMFVAFTTTPLYGCLMFVPPLGLIALAMLVVSNWEEVKLPLAIKVIGVVNMVAVSFTFTALAPGH